MYNLGGLGWLQFQRLCDAALGVDPGLWEGSADGLRSAVVDGGLTLPDGRRLERTVTVDVCWLRGDERRVLEIIARRGPLQDDRVLVANRDMPGIDLGPRALSAALDADPELRLRCPAVLGLRRLEEIVADDARESSTLDLAAARELARVFVPTRAYDRTLRVLAGHGFAVLAGPPEMGKTAIARMVGLARMTAGWEAHECTRPDQVLDRRDPARPQVFIADDAFGSTEYRPDAAERWARELPRILRGVDDRHWLIWTSRPAPLRAGLHRVHLERGAEHFPSPAQVVVDAADLDTDEKALILLRHVKAAGLDAETRRRVRGGGAGIVAHPHFTPERIRRFVARRLPLEGSTGIAAAVEAELTTPTEAMAASLEALAPEHRDLLVAMLDTPPGPVPERDLAASLRRHHDGGVSRAPADLIDRLTDHFLRVTA